MNNRSKNIPLRVFGYAVVAGFLFGAFLRDYNVPWWVFLSLLLMSWVAGYLAATASRSRRRRQIKSGSLLSE